MIHNIKSELIDLITDLFQYNGFDADMIEYVDLIDDIGIDSMTFISLVVEIEDKFSVKIPDDLLLMENFKTIDDTVKIIRQAFVSESAGTEVQKNDET